MDKKLQTTVSTIEQQVTALNFNDAAGMANAATMLMMAHLQQRFSIRPDYPHFC